MKILLTGGLGYLGSHIYVELVQQGHEVTIATIVRNSSSDVVSALNEITGQKCDVYNIDLRNELEIDIMFREIQFDAVIHLSGYNSISRSIIEPLNYYENNVVSTLWLLKMCKQYDIPRFIFASSASVYGDEYSPMSESLPMQRPTSPYGETKFVCENMLRYFSNANKTMSITISRTFNPIGAHESGLIGDKHTQNILSHITKVASGKQELLRIFGNDYETYDGTSVRDYIHIVDVAKAHVKMIENSSPGFNVYNVGTGIKTSILTIIKRFEEVTGVTVIHTFAERRKGEVAEAYADVSKIKNEIDFEPTKTLDDMIRDAWNYEGGQ